MKTVNVYEAKTHLSQLLDLAAAGEEAVIARAGRPLAKLVGYTVDDKPGKPGYWKGKGKLGDISIHCLPTSPRRFEVKPSEVLARHSRVVMVA